MMTQQTKNIRFLVVSAVLLACVSFQTLAQAEETTTTTTTTTVQQKTYDVKPTEKQEKKQKNKVSKRWYYDYRTSETFCLTPTEAFRKELSSASAGRPCTDDEKVKKIFSK